MSSSEKILVGKVAAPHGLKGEVAVITFTAQPENVGAYGPLFLEDGTQLTLIGLKKSKETRVIVRFKEVQQREAAEMIKGQHLYIERDCLPPLGEDDFYHHELLSLAVQNEHKVIIGRVKAVQNFGASDILEIATKSGDFFMVPFIQEAILHIDKAQKLLTLYEAFIV